MESNQQQAELQVEGFARLGMLQRASRRTEFPDRLDEWIEERSQQERNNVLSIEVDRMVRIVLCTGGPHCEVQWPEGDNPSVLCYGWFGADRFERELTQDEIAGIESALGNWGDLAFVEEERGMYGNY